MKKIKLVCEWRRSRPNTVSSWTPWVFTAAFIDKRVERLGRTPDGRSEYVYTKGEMVSPKA